MSVVKMADRKGLACKSPRPIGRNTETPSGKRRGFAFGSHAGAIGKTDIECVISVTGLFLNAHKGQIDLFPERSKIERSETKREAE